MDDIERLGLAAAKHVAGAAAVARVDVAFDADSEQRPAYRFTFLLDQDRLDMNVGLFRIRLSQRLRDELAERGDDHLPMLRILDETDWNRWKGDQPV